MVKNEVTNKKVESNIKFDTEWNEKYHNRYKRQPVHQNSSYALSPRKAVPQRSIIRSLAFLLDTVFTA